MDDRARYRNKQYQSQGQIWQTKNKSYLRSWKRQRSSISAMETTLASKSSTASPQSMRIFFQGTATPLRARTSLSTLRSIRSIRNFSSKRLRIIKSCEVSVEEFFEIVKKKSTDENSEAKIFVTIMLSVSEYTNFVEMMRAYKREHE
ncbi:hypothetical protein FGO68_gene16664 [Halteria grandinella]|uniref:BART domain-containing protein n=1 Tax=Halteria grandinella TaxID=5974 RepID=A0A8J8NJV4_HALGN|nr:hypothetical protein FGO68_gene16664 [Halteria grandinella]